MIVHRGDQKRASRT